MLHCRTLENWPRSALLYWVRAPLLCFPACTVGCCHGMCDARASRRRLLPPCPAPSPALAGSTVLTRTTLQQSSSHPCLASTQCNVHLHVLRTFVVTCHLRDKRADIFALPHPACSLVLSQSGVDHPQLQSKKTSTHTHARTHTHTHVFSHTLA